MSATAPTLRDVYQFTLGQLTEQEQKLLATAFSAVSVLSSVLHDSLQSGSSQNSDSSRRVAAALSGFAACACC